MQTVKLSQYEHMHEWPLICTIFKGIWISLICNLFISEKKINMLLDGMPFIQQFP